MNCNCENPKCPICFERNYQNSKLDMVRDRLISAMGERFRLSRYRNPTHGEYADAILASGVLDQIKADAWDEGHAVANIETRLRGAGDTVVTLNPYRKEGATT